MRFSISILCAFYSCTLFSGRAAEPPGHLANGTTPGSSATPAPQKLRVKMWYVPFEHYPSQQLNDVPTDQIPEAEALVDARQGLEGIIRAQFPGKEGDIHFTPGEEAFFNRRLRVLVVRARPEAIAVIDHYSRYLWQPYPVNMFGGTALFRADVSLVEFSASKQPELNGKTSLETLKKGAGDSWRVLNRMQIMARHGGYGKAISKAGNREENPVVPALEEDQSNTLASMALPPGECGSTLYVGLGFSSLTPGSHTVFANDLLYQFRAAGPPEWNWKTLTNVTVKDGQPVLVQVEPVPSERKRSQPRNFRGLILRVDVIPFGDVAFHPETHLGDPAPSPAP